MADTLKHRLYTGGSPEHSESPQFPSDIPSQPPLQPSLSSSSIPGLANLGDAGMLPDLNSSLGGVGGVGMDMNMNLGGIANLPSLTSTGVYSLDSTMDPPGMDVWLAPAPAQQTLVPNGLEMREGEGGRASSPILGMDGDRDVDWGGLFGNTNGGGTNSYGTSIF